MAEDMETKFEETMAFWIWRHFEGFRLSDLTLDQGELEPQMALYWHFFSSPAFQGVEAGNGAS